MLCAYCLGKIGRCLTCCGISHRKILRAILVGLIVELEMERIGGLQLGRDEILMVVAGTAVTAEDKGAVA